GLVLREAFLQPRDEPALSPVAERAPVSGAPLLSSSEPAPWLGQTYAWQRVCGRQVFLPPFLLLSLLPFYKFTHGSSPLSRARFLRYILFMDGVVDLTRLCFVHAKDVYQILNIGRMQAFQIRKPGFHQRHCLFFGDRQSAGQRPRRLGNLLLYRRRRRRVFVDVDFPTGKPLSQTRVLSLFSDRERKLIFVH